MVHTWYLAEADLLEGKHALRQEIATKIEYRIWASNQSAFMRFGEEHIRVTDRLISHVEDMQNLESYRK